MDRLGMSAEEQAQITEVLDYPHGIILVTGPDRLGQEHLPQRLPAPDQLDRPADHHDRGPDRVRGALASTRCRCAPRSGSPSPTRLRHVLRQDPDVIMVGEIRDLETAEIAIRASLTGHLVFSTLHTNDAPGAITRLVDMGIEPFLVASAIELVIAQRLVRRLCPECARRSAR